MKTKTRILSLAGGGGRCIIESAFMAEIEKMLCKEAGKVVKLADYFDMIAGTSGGGILALAYAMKERSAVEIHRMLVANVGLIFSRDAWHRMKSLGGVIDHKYSSDGLLVVLHTLFGQTTIDELPVDVLIPSFDVATGKGVFFSSLKDHNARLIDAAQATSAAPTYFMPARDTLIDGAMVANQPAMCAISELRGYNQDMDAEDVLLLAVNAGHCPAPFDPAGGDGLLQYATALVDMFINGDEGVVGYQLKQVFSGSPRNYLAISPVLDHPIAIDDTTNETIALLCWIGEEAAKRSEVEEFVLKLINN